MSCKFGRVTRKSVFSLKRTWQHSLGLQLNKPQPGHSAVTGLNMKLCVPKNYGVKYEASCLTLDLKLDHATGQ